MKIVPKAWYLHEYMAKFCMYEMKKNENGKVDLSHLRVVLPRNEGILHIHEMTKMKKWRIYLSILRAILPRNEGILHIHEMTKMKK